MSAENGVERVHLVFKTHLDLGFTDYAGRVEEQYFTDFIPRALATAAELRRRGGEERFVWTTGSWLVYEYLERAGAAERRVMEEAIAAGDMAWHALPFTLHTELADESLFAFGLELSQELDRRFGRRTVAAKMTDVPGHTRGIVPLLAAAGVELLHLGVNASSTPPDVPPVFVWRSPGGAEVAVMYQRGGYGDVVPVAGLGAALAFAHTNDNHGPQGADEVAAEHAALRARFPAARVAASTMDAFAAELRAVRSALPVMTQEMGDTWIHGVGTDPLKVSRFRELSRLRREWLEARGVARERLAQFSRRLLLVPEHTWGMDLKTHLDDYANYAADDLRAARATERYRAFEASWAEQRAYVDAAVAALDEELAVEARARLAELTPARVDVGGYEPVVDGRDVSLGAWRVTVDREAGTATLLRADEPLLEVGALGYQTFSAADYDRFRGQYSVNKRQTRSWAIPDFTKPGIAAAGAESRWWRPEIAAVYRREDEGGARVLLELAMPAEASERFGCPRAAMLELTLARGGDEVLVELQWFDKPACRLPEALWLSLTPAGATMRGWRMLKLGEWVSPLDVMRDGNRRLHAAQAVEHEGMRGRVRVGLLDAALVAPGEPSLLNFTNRQPVGGAMHVNLYNNVWGTNFPMWYEEDARFRFIVRL
ncbi:MAG: hypothetical protein RLZZ387_1656 [Chloroflexota bacterium]